MIIIKQILILLIIANLSMGCQNENVLYHSCGTSASAYNLSEWNIDDPNDRFAMRETIDKQGRVKKFEFSINNDYPTLCYLPRTVEYDYMPNKIIETLYSSPGQIMYANDCEMNYKTVYHLKDSLITNIESFFEIDTVNYTIEELTEIRKYIKPHHKYKPENFFNAEIEYYIFSHAKYNGKHPTNKGYIFPIGNYYYDVDPVNRKLKNGLIHSVKLNQKEYPYQTELHNGYKLKYEIIEDSESRIQRISLIQGDRTIKRLSDNSYGLPFKNLGYIEAEFKSSFAYVQSYGSGNPHNFQLINKEDGEKIIEGLWIDANPEQEVILYYLNEENSQSIKLYDVRKSKDVDISNLNNANCYDLNECFSIDEVSSDMIIIKQEIKSIAMTNKYYR